MMAEPKDDDEKSHARPPEKLESEPWWQCDEGSDEVAQKAYAVAQRLYSGQHETAAQMERDCRALYEGNAARELGLLAAASWGVDPATFNVIGSVTDTLCAHVFKNKVRPFLLTKGGSYEEREAAQKDQIAVEGELKSHGIYGELGAHVCWDGEVFRAGCVKVTPDYANARVTIDRIMASKVYLDQRDAKLGKPRSWHYIDTIDRAVLLDYCKNASEEVREAIRTAKPAPVEMYDDEEQLDENETSDRVAFAELWHLPSGRVDKKSDGAWKIGAEHDGRHTLILWEAKDSASVLHDEAWPYDYPPIAFFRPKKRRVGFWSESMPERHCGSQLAINRMLQRVDGVMDLHAVPRCYVNKQAKVNTDKITNSWADVIEGNGPADSAIKWFTPPTIQGEYLNQIDKIIQWVRNREGISELSANGERPPGDWSGVALQTILDSESVGFTGVFRAWEDFHLDLCRIVLDAFRLLKEAGVNMKIVWGDAKELHSLNLSELDLEEDKYHVTAWPTNLFSQSPTALMQQLGDFGKAFPSLVTPELVLRLLDFPDWKAAMGDVNAAERNVKFQLDQLQKGELVPPDPYLALDMAFKMGVDRLNSLAADGAPDEKLDPIRQWVEDIKKLMPPPPPPAPVQAPVTGLPTAA